LALPKALQRTVREEVRRELNDNGGPLDIEVEFRFGNGQA
jgi:hypothetical protein